jgi:hypothetical protein
MACGNEKFTVGIFEDDGELLTLVSLANIDRDGREWKPGI